MGGLVAARGHVLESRPKTPLKAECFGVIGLDGVYDTTIKLHKGALHIGRRMAASEPKKSS